MISWDVINKVQKQIARGPGQSSKEEIDLDIDDDFD